MTEDRGMAKRLGIAVVALVSSGAWLGAGCEPRDPLPTDETALVGEGGNTGGQSGGAPEAGGAAGTSSVAGLATGGIAGASGGTAGQSGGTDSPEAIALTPDEAAALCAPALGQKLPTGTIAEMKAALPGAWVLCSAQGIFTRPQAGIYIGPNDRWALMTWSGEQLVVQRGLDYEGSLEYIDTSEMNGRPTIQVNFVNEYAWTFIAAPPTFSDEPRMMVLTTNVVSPMRYAAGPGS